MKIFHHNDMDGILSAKIIIDFLKIENIIVNPKDVIEMDYTKEFPLNEIQKGEEIYIVDYSIAPNVMFDLLNKTPRVVWIDHHISAIEKYKDFVTPMEASKPKWKIPGIRADGIAGCVLTYWYFHGRQADTEQFIKEYPKNIDSRFRKEIPLYIKLAGDWDVWEHLYGHKTKNYTICFNTAIDNPFSPILNEIKNSEALESFIKNGDIMTQFRNSWAKTFMKRYGFETTIDGYRAFVANLGNANSEFFGDLINNYDIVGTFCTNGETYNCSLYSNKDYIDCSQICLKRGGGGHKGAAGFVCKEIPFKKEEK